MNERRSLSNYDAIIKDRRMAMGETTEIVAIACEVDVLNAEERVEYYELKTQAHAGKIEEKYLCRGIYNCSDITEHRQLVAAVARELYVSESLLKDFHLDILRGMRSLQTGEWLLCL